MKKEILFSALYLLLPLLLSAQNQVPAKDVADIHYVIQKSYIEGIHNNGDISEIEKGFHPGFEMLSVSNNELTKLGIATWIENIKKRRSSPEYTPGPEVICKYLDTSVTGDAAVVGLQLWRQGILLFTDYLCLYRFGDGWKIVTKLYHRH